jgi:hypothetical protein
MAAMKPIPHVHASPEMPFPGGVGWSAKTTLLNGPSGRMSRPNLNIGALLSLNSGVSASNKDQSIQAPAPAQIFSLNCVPLKKHGCNRRHMLECTEVSFMVFFQNSMLVQTFVLRITASESSQFRFWYVTGGIQERCYGVPYFTWAWPSCHFNRRRNIS